jgi:hypothetical protein
MKEEERCDNEYMERRLYMKPPWTKRMAKAQSAHKEGKT